MINNKIMVIVNLLVMPFFYASEPKAQFQGILGHLKKKFDNNMVNEFNEIITVSRKNMSPQIVSCETLECIESLLQEKGKDAIDNLFIDTPEELALQRKALLNEFVRRERNKLRMPSETDVNHDTTALGTNLVEHTKKVLREHDIDPSQVNIIGLSDSEIDIDVLVRARCSTAHEKDTIEYNLRRLDEVQDAKDYVIRHEVTHIDRSHPLMDSCLRALMPRESTSPASLRLNRSDELEAMIRPLMTYDNGDAILSQLFENDIKDCVNDHRKGVLASTGISRPTSTHPDCTEWLPYALRVKDIRDKGAKPLAINKKS